MPLIKTVFRTKTDKDFADYHFFLPTLPNLGDEIFFSDGPDDLLDFDWIVTNRIFNITPDVDEQLDEVILNLEPINDENKSL